VEREVVADPVERSRARLQPIESRRGGRSAGPEQEEPVDLG